jgi:hypothetical protein
LFYAQQIGLEESNKPGEGLNISFPIDRLDCDKSQLSLYFIELCVEEIHGGN